MAVVSMTVSFFLAKSLVKKSPAVILSERSLTDTALSFFSEDVKALTASQIALQQQEINSRLLKLSEQDAQIRAKIESIPMWAQTKLTAFWGSFIVSGVCLISVTISGCLIMVRRKTLVSMVFGTSQVSLPYRQVATEDGAIRVLQMALTEISQGTLDKQDLFRLFDMSVRSVRGQHNHTQPMIDVTPGTPALSAGQVPAVTFQDAMKSFKPGEILVGFDKGNPIHFPIKGLVSSAAGGESDSGKTSKLCFLTGQLICNNAEVRILDAHDGMDESLVNRLGSLARFPNVKIYPPYDLRDAVEDMISEVQEIIDAKVKAVPPKIYILDELKPLNHACDRVEYLMTKIANEGRKFNIFGIFASQTWEANMFKESGSAAKDACVLKFAARMPKEQARILFKDRDAANAVSKLGKPDLYISSIRYTGTVQVPFAAPADMELLALEYLQKRENVVNGYTENIKTVAQNHLRQEIVENTTKDMDQEEVTPEVTEALPVLSENSGVNDLAPKIRQYLSDNDVTLSKFAADCGVNKGLLSSLLNSGKPLSPKMTELVTAYINRGNSEVTPSKIIVFPGVTK